MKLCPKSREKPPGADRRRRKSRTFTRFFHSSVSNGCGEQCPFRTDPSGGGCTGCVESGEICGRILDGGDGWGGLRWRGRVCSRTSRSVPAAWPACHPSRPDSLDAAATRLGSPAIRLDPATVVRRPRTINRPPTRRRPVLCTYSTRLTSPTALSTPPKRSPGPICPGLPQFLTGADHKAAAAADVAVRGTVPRRAPLPPRAPMSRHG